MLRSDPAGRVKSFLSKLLSPPSPQEENQKILDQAVKFDRLISEPAWNDVIGHMAERVNMEITAGATTDPMKPYEQTLHVIRWNAMRELMDEALDFVNSTRKQRDEILAMEREEEEYVNAARNA